MQSSSRRHLHRSRPKPGRVQPERCGSQYREFEDRVRVDLVKYRAEFHQVQYRTVACVFINRDNSRCTCDVMRGMQV